MIRRREFITLLGAAGAVWPDAGHTQKAIPTVGLLGGVSPENYDRFVAAILQGLREAGFVSGENVRIEQLWARGQLDQLPSLARELTDHRVSVIMTVGGTSVALAVKHSGTTIPVVFALGSDPVEDGLVTSLSRPGGNITGVTFFTNALLAKRLELLLEIVPRVSLIGAVVNPKNARATRDTNDLTTAARSIGRNIEFVQASTQDELDASFAKLIQTKADALLITSDAFFTTRREQLVALAGRHKVPATFGSREFAAAGGLMSYGANVADSHRQAGIYAGRILTGIKPSDLPVLQPTKFELVINLKTAKALGIMVPPTLLARADEVIE